jgi:hypothetical protein
MVKFKARKISDILDKRKKQQIKPGTRWHNMPREIRQVIFNQAALEKLQRKYSKLLARATKIQDKLHLEKCLNWLGYLIGQCKARAVVTDKLIPRRRALFQQLMQYFKTIKRCFISRKNRNLRDGINDTYKALLAEWDEVWEGICLIDGHIMKHMFYLYPNSINRNPHCNYIQLQDEGNPDRIWHNWEAWKVYMRNVKPSKPIDNEDDAEPKRKRSR